MTSKVLVDRVRSSAGGDGVPSLQRSQAVDHGEKDLLDPNLVSRLDSGLGAGTTCSSMDGNENGNTAVGVSSTGGLNETSAGQVFRSQEEFASDKSNNETTAFGEAGYDEAGLCSEEDVLNFTFKVCDTESTGRVAASAIIQYLREVTGQGTDGRLQVLHNMLDPERKGVAVDRGSFHLTMRRWIANCTQDGPSDEKASLNLRENPRLQLTEGDEISHLVPWPLEEGMDDPRIEASELTNKMADLKYANKKLREQNTSLQKALELSDETNLQLTKELTKVKNQLISSQRTLRSMQTMVEELEDARSAGRDARERVNQLGTQCKELKKEKEALGAQLWSASGKIEKLERDKRELKYQIDELLAQKADLTKQIHEAQNQLISKDALIFEENIMIEELKMLKAESCKVIEGLRAELKRSQGKICQDFFSCKLGVTKSSPGRALNQPIWSPTSLQVEIRETQKLEGCEALPDPVCGLVLHKDQGDHLQEILTHIKAKRHGALFQRTVDELVDQLNVHAATFMTLLRRMETGQQLNVQDLRLELEQTMQAVVRKLHLLAPVKDSWDESMEALEVACVRCQQDYINAKQNLANILRELELEKVLREEAEEHAAEAEQRAEEAWLEAKAVSGRSLASRKLKESEEKRAEREEQSCSLELQVRCLGAEADAESGKVKREMAEALEAAEARAQASEAKSSEVVRKLEEREREAAAEGARAARCLAEAEGLREEVERLKTQAAESLLDSTRRIRTLEEQVATLSQELAAAQQDVSAAQHRAAVAEAGLAAATVGRPGTEGQRKVTAADAGETEQTVGSHPSVQTSTKQSPRTLNGELQACPSPAENVTDGRIAQSLQQSVHECNSNSAIRKQETDVRPLSQEIFELLRHQRLSTHSGRCNDGRPGQYSSLLEALNLELSGSHQPLGTQKCFRPLLFDQSRGEEGRPSSPKESLTKGQDSETAGRNSVGGSRSQELDVKQRLSPEAEEQLPPTALPEDEDLASVSSLRQLLNNFSLAGLEPSLIRGARCVIAPSMPTLPEEEVRPEHQEATQSTKPNVLAAGTGMNTTPEIVLPEVTGSSDKESDRATHLRCPSPIQRKSSRNSRASLSSASSLTSVDGDGHVYDLVNDQLPDVELSDEDRKKNTELLEEAKKISERFLSRRSRRSRTSISDSPPAVTPSRTPTASPSPSHSNSVTALHLEPDMPAVRTMVVPSLQAGEEDASSPIRDKEMKLLEVPGSRQQDAGVRSEQHTRKLSPARTTSETRKLSPAKKAVENRKPSPGPMAFQMSPGKVADTSVHRKEAASLEVGGRSESKPLDKNRHSTHVKGAVSALAGPTKPRSLECNMIPVRPPQALVSETGAVRTSIEHAVPRPRKPCTAEIKSLSSQPLLRAVSWECLEVDGEPPSPPFQAVESFSFNVFDNSQLRAFDCKELPVEPKLQKLTKLREENKLMRNQNLSAQRLPDLSETNEQERGPSPVPCPAANGTQGSSDAMPSIPDSLLRKLKVQRALPVGLPPLTEKEVENTFVQLSLAFKNDSYTLEARLGLAERERNLAEDNTERELENFKSELKSSTSLWVNAEQREAQERLLETVAVLQRLAIRLSGRAEMVGAVRQEKRMSKATEVMMQYVENLKRMYEKDHAELTEFKKLANQNSNRNYSPYGDSSDDGVPRTARSMSLTLGKSVPRRRVSVAVLPKFINFPGQPGSSSAVPTIAPVMESNNNTEANTAGSTSNSSSSEAITSTTSTVPSSSSRTSPMLAPLMETKQNGDKEVEQTAAGTVRPPSLDLTSLETKAKIEEEAFNKGYREGLKAQLSQDQKELRHETGKAEGASEGPPTETVLTGGRKASKLEEVAELIVRLCPKPARHRSVIWVVAAIVLLLAVLSSIFASLRSPCEQAAGSPSAKGSCLPSGHSSTWPFSRLWHRNRAQA